MRRNKNINVCATACIIGGFTVVFTGWIITIDEIKWSGIGVMLIGLLLDFRFKRNL